MRSASVMSLDGPAAVKVATSPEPPADPDLVQVEVHMAGVSFPDVLLTRGLYQVKPEPPFVLGAEFAGVVRSAPVSADLRPGDRVAGVVVHGAFAGVVAARPQFVVPLPDDLSFETASAMPMNYLTAHFMLTRRARLRDGETMLVHGGAGGIGTATVQVGRTLGATVIAVVSNPAKRDVALQAGAHHVVGSQTFRDEVAELTSGRGVDIVVDPVGGDRFTDSLRCLSPEGRLLVVGFTAGEIPSVKVNRLLLNNIDVRGVAWGPYAMAKPGYIREQWRDLTPMLRFGDLHPVISDVYDLQDVGQALTEIEDRHVLGKVLLRIGEHS